MKGIIFDKFHFKIYNVSKDKNDFEGGKNEINNTKWKYWRLGCCLRS